MFDSSPTYAKDFGMKFLHLLALVTVSLILTPAMAEEKDDPLFRHAVYFRFQEDATEDQVQTIVDEFLLLEEKIDTIVDIEWGVSESVEGLNDGFTHCFLVSFEDKAGLEVYLPHPAHKAFVEKLKPILDEAFVFDYTQRE